MSNVVNVNESPLGEDGATGTVTFHFLELSSASRHACPRACVTRLAPLNAASSLFLTGGNDVIRLTQFATSDCRTDRPEAVRAWLHKNEAKRFFSAQ